MNYLNKLYSMLPKRIENEKGATMVEYALMLALIAVVCVAAVSGVGTGADGMFDQIATKLGFAG